MRSADSAPGAPVAPVTAEEGLAFEDATSRGGCSVAAGDRVLGGRPVPGMNSRYVKIGESSRVIRSKVDPAAREA